MQPEERIRHVRLKIERAEEHLAALTSEVQAFLGSKPYTLRAGTEPSTERVIYYVHDAREVPDRITLLLADALQNAVTALDHLAYQLVSQDTTDPPPKPHKIYFPIADSESTYQELRTQQLPGASPRTIAAIDALRPFRGGNDDLWRLSRLNRIEKHRLLLTVGSSAGGVDIGAMMWRTSLEAAPARLKAKMEKLLPPLILLEEHPNPAVAKGLPLYSGAPGERPDHTLQFLFRVSLNEPTIAEKLSVTACASASVAAARGAMLSLAPLFDSAP